MPFLHRTHHTATLLLCVTMIALASPARAIAQNESAALNESELRRTAASQVLAGDFKNAAQTYERMLKNEPGSDRSRMMLDWVRSVEDLQAQREALRKKTFDRHVEAARTLKERGKWSLAVEQIRLAELNAARPGEVREIDWLGELIEKTREEIRLHENKGEWLDALILYEVLARIHQDTPEGDAFKKEAERSRQRAHFEALYVRERAAADTGEEEDPDEATEPTKPVKPAEIDAKAWEDDLREIRAEIVAEVFGRVQIEHYQEPDFKKMVLSGLDNIRIMVSTPKLVAAFEQLADEARLHDFTARLNKEIERIEKGPRLNRAAETVARFERLMEINRGTLNLPSQVLTYEFVNGALSPLDEFTSVIWPSEKSDFEKHTHGEFTGVGIQITKPNGKFLRVETPLEDSPAYEAGVSPGDFITAVDGTTTDTMKLTEAVSRITGPEGTKVTLTLQRAGIDKPDDTFDIQLTRRKIIIKSVKGAVRRDDGKSWDFMIDEKNAIGYMRISQFTKDTVPDMRAALRSLKSKGVRGLIIDLRYNPGGLLSAAIEACELFLKEGQPIVKTDGRAHPARPPAVAREDAYFDGCPIIVLVNGQSASASEILAGTLAGNGKAFVIGERTYGKGSVQNLYEIAEQTAYFKLTTALYYVPLDPLGKAWRCLHHTEGEKFWGVEPQLEVKLIPHEVVRLWELRRKQDILKGAKQKELPKQLFDRPQSPSTRPDDDIEIPNEAPEIDPQLETALAVMRIMLAGDQPWVMAPPETARRTAQAVGG